MPANAIMLMVLLLLTSHLLLEQALGYAGSATAPPPCKYDQDRQDAEKPRQCCPRVRDQGIARITLSDDWIRRRHAGQFVNQGQDFAAVGRAAACGTAPIRVFDFAIGLLAGAADHALTGGSEADAHVGHDALQLCEHVAPQVRVARVLGGEVNRDIEPVAESWQRALVGS